MNERAVTICRGCVDLAGMPMTNDDPFIVIAGYRIVIAPPATKNFNSQNVRCWLDAIGVLSLDGEGEFSVFSFQFSVFRGMAKMIQLNTTHQFVMQLIAAPPTAIVTHYASCLATSPKVMQYVADDSKLGSSKLGDRALYRGLTTSLLAVIPRR